MRRIQLFAIAFCALALFSCDRKEETGLYDNSIFLPAAGDRYDCKTFYQSRRGYYWSSTPCRNDSSLAHSLFFFASNTYPVRCYRDRWQPVRLVIV